MDKENGSPTKKIIVITVFILVALVASILFSVKNQENEAKRALDFSGSDGKLVGQWEIDGKKMGTELPFFMEFGENMSCKTRIVNSSSEGTYQINQTHDRIKTTHKDANLDSDSKYYFDGDNLVLVIDDSKLYFNKIQNNIDFMNAEQFESSSNGKNATTTQTPAPTSDPVSIDISSGNYTCGTDFPPGTYDITLVSGNGNVICSGKINEIFRAEDGYTQSFSNAKFVNGDILQIKGGVTINLASK
ncbi:MAG: hypothetical protein VB081_11610 [Christensenella sp.]|uniref:hypothetical protein n=1 Tax=Christensenella sp. TaxID=1935934 RepID=UPI002B21B469|nr:hypothetical protein [Christensenella sp.]MEA5004133.1 hypothetical protein [Christensenella sp.]